MSAALLPSRRPGAHPPAWLVTVLLLAGLMACSESPAPPGPGPGDEPAPATTAGDGPSADAADAGNDAPVAETADDDAPPADAPGSSETDPATPAVDEPAPLPDLTDWLSTEGHLGLHTLAWRPLDHDKVPRNQEFSAEVLLLRDDAPAPGARLQVTGYMPAHAHGLVQMPVCEEVGEGRYRVDGLLLHMRGHWQVRFTIVADRQVETATFELDL